MERKRRLPPVIDRLPGNPIGLFQRGNDVLMDERDPPGGPARVGEWVIVSARPVPPPGSAWVCGYEYVLVAIAEVGPEGLYRGVVREPPFAQLFRPDVLTLGTPLTFGMAHVFVVRPGEEGRGRRELTCGSVV